MIQLEKYAAILFLLNYFYNDGSAADFPFYGVQVEPLFSQLSFRSNHENVFYVTCNKIIYKSPEHFGRAINKSNSCNFNIQTRRGQDAYVRSCYNILGWYSGILGTYVPQFINDRKVLIKYSFVNPVAGSSSSIIKYKILDFTDCTLESSLEVPIDDINENDFIHLSVTNATIDVFFSRESVCKEKDQLCQISYNLQGEQLGNPKLISSGRVYHVAQVNDQEPEKGRYLNLGDGWNWIISHIDSTGRANQVFSTPISNKITGEVDYKTQFSNAYELYGFCMPHTTNQLHLNQEYKAIGVTCLQFDTQGIKLNTTLQVDKTSLAIAVHNLPNNEMLLATANVEESNNPTAIIDSINVYKIGKNGSSFNSLLIRGLTLKYRFTNPPHPNFDFVKMSISERPNNKICMHVACISPFETTKGLQYGPLQYDVKCIPKQKLLDL